MTDFTFTLAQITSGSAPPPAGAAPAPAPVAPAGTAAAPAGAPATQAPSDPGAGAFIMPLLLMGGLLLMMYFMVIRPKRREEVQRNQMIDALKKGDKIITVGGVIGTVTDLRDDHVVVKVDETNNTRIHFSKLAVQRVVER